MKAGGGATAQQSAQSMLNLRSVHVVMAAEGAYVLLLLLRRWAEGAGGASTGADGGWLGLCTQLVELVRWVIWGFAFVLG